MDCVPNLPTIRLLLQQWMADGSRLSAPPGRWAIQRNTDDRVIAAATVRTNGMHWVGETAKYFGTDLQVFRLRTADLNKAAPEGHHPPNLPGHHI